MECTGKEIRFILVGDGIATLQFADDIILLIEYDFEQARNIIIVFFE